MLPHWEEEKHMTPDAPDFKTLVKLLAERHHDGAIYPMAERVGVSSALMDKWAHGTVKNPTNPSLRKLCRAYHLDFLKVLTIVEKGRGMLVALVAFALWASTAVEALSVVGGNSPRWIKVTEVPLIGSWRRQPWWDSRSPTVGWGLAFLYLMFYRARRSTIVSGGDHRSTRPIRRPLLTGACA